MTARDATQAVKAYYDRNTLPFLRFGGSGVAVGAIHREVWAAQVQTSEQAFEYVHHQVKAHCIAGSGDGSAAHLLDLGCGVGGTATWLATATGCRVHGVTLSPLQAEVAAQRAHELGLGGLCQFEVGDMTALGCAAQRQEITSRASAVTQAQEPIQVNAASPASVVSSVDVRYTGAYAIESLIHVADAPAFFESARRVLAAGAPLVVCDDFLASRDVQTTAAQQRELQRFRHGWRAFGLRTAEQVKQVAQQFGFELKLEQNLTPDLRCVPAWVTVPCGWLLRWPGLQGEYWGSLRGSTALQNCIREGLTEYRFLLWSAPGKRC